MFNSQASLCVLVSNWQVLCVCVLKRDTPRSNPGTAFPQNALDSFSFFLSLFYLTLLHLSHLACLTGSCGVCLLSVLHIVYAKPSTVAISVEEMVITPHCTEIPV